MGMGPEKGEIKQGRFDFQKGDTEGVVNYALSLKGIIFAAIFIAFIRISCFHWSVYSKRFKCAKIPLQSHIFYGAIIQGVTLSGSPIYRPHHFNRIPP